MYGASLAKGSESVMPLCPQDELQLNATSSYSHGRLRERKHDQGKDFRRREEGRIFTCMGHNLGHVDRFFVMVY
jgi:hypothetical protein